MNKPVSYKNILTLAIPAIISGISEPLIGSTDLVLVGKNTVNGIAVVGIGGSAILSVIWIFSSLLSPISARVAHLFGANKIDQLHTLINFLLSRLVIFSVVIALFLFFLAEPIIAFYDSSDSQISEIAKLYFQIRLIGLPFFLVSVFCFQVFRGLQNTMIALIVTLVAGMVNLVFDFILIKGLFGFPEMGALGAAVASLLSNVVMAIGALIYFYRFQLFQNKTKTTIYLSVLFTNSFNLFLRTILLNACILIGNRITTKQGGNFIELHTILANVFIIIAYFLDGIAHAATALIGKLKGEGDLLGIRNVAFKSLLLNTTIAAFFTAFVYFFSAMVLSFYTPKEAILGLFVEERDLFLATVFIGSIAFTFDGIYIGLEKTIFLRNVLVVATLVGYFPVLLLTNDYTLHGVWVALLVWIVFRSGIPFIHFLFFKDKKNQDRSSVKVCE
jgi:MATE family multidrug resistance protein